MNKECVHQPLEQEITAIGGHYVITDEIRLPFDGREVLYLKGYALIDTSCCGVGGCAFVHVQGFIKEWKGRTNEDGHKVSLCELIIDERTRGAIESLIKEKEVFHQIRFD